MKAIDKYRWFQDNYDRLSPEACIQWDIVAHEIASKLIAKLDRRKVRAKCRKMKLKALQQS